MSILQTDHLQQRYSEHDGHLEGYAATEHRVRKRREIRNHIMCYSIFTVLVAARARV